jgi:hypothetical protein
MRTRSWCRIASPKPHGSNWFAQTASPFSRLAVRSDLSLSRCCNRRPLARWGLANWDRAEWVFCRRRGLLSPRLLFKRKPRAQYASRGAALAFLLLVRSMCINVVFYLTAFDQKSPNIQTLLFTVPPMMAIALPSGEGKPQIAPPPTPGYRLNT